MHISYCKILLRLPTCHNLKSKRRILHSLITRVRNRYNVAIAEINSGAAWQSASIGIAALSGDGRHCEAIISNILHFINTDIKADFEVIEQYQNTLSGL